MSYFVGEDPAKWRAAVPVWSGVRYVDLYPGIDLEVSVRQREDAMRLEDGEAERLRLESPPKFVTYQLFSHACILPHFGV